MKISFEVNEIDYGALAELFLPMLREKLEEKDDMGILSKIAGIPPSLAAKMIAMLPQDTKDELAVMLVGKNKEKIIKAILEYAGKKGLSFQIDTFEVE